MSSSRSFLGCLVTALCASAPLAAHAGTVYDQGLVLKAAASGFAFNGVGAPSIVAYPDGAGGTAYRMYFETTVNTIAGCSSTWSIGMATSADGLTWTRSGSAVFTASSGSFYGCSVAHPEVHFDGATWHLFFTGSTATSSGIGHATSTDGIRFGAATQIVNRGSTANIGDASVTQLDGVLYLYYTLGKSIYGIQSSDGGSSWTAPVARLAPTTSLAWTVNGVQGASAVCDEFGLAADPIVLGFYGFDATNAKTYALATTPDGAAMTIDIAATPYTLSSGARPGWNHWDLLETDSGYVYYYSMTDAASGKKAIGFATQNATIGWSEASQNACVTDPGPVDSDHDGVPDVDDAFPSDPSETADSDADGVGENGDRCPGSDDRLDADADGAADGCDVCPNDLYNDSDGDALCDSADACPLDVQNDADQDGRCGDEDLCANDAYNDADGDGICGDVDVCPLDAANDADGDGDCADRETCPGFDDRVDTDGDTVPDGCDVCPLDANNDSDGDGTCDSADRCPLDYLNDRDGDGACDSDDACPADAADDVDGDGMCADVDPCPRDVANDADGDGLCESNDNCPAVANASQADTDLDGIGNACEADNDGDGVADDNDNCPEVAYASQLDSDGDGLGDACDQDDDGDGVNDGADACPATPVGALVVETNGCSVDQTCSPTATWKNHGAYVSCVAAFTSVLVSQGDLTSTQRSAIVAAAAQSSIGKSR